MIIKSALSLLKQARYVKKIMKKHQNVLHSGEYRLFDNFRSICLKESTIQAKAQAYFRFGKASEIRIKIAKALNKGNYFKLSPKSSEEQYEAIYVANNYDKLREVKLFSFTNKKILTLCTSREKMCKQVGEYQQLHHAYKMPYVVQNQQFENALDVVMVERLPFPGDDQALTTIAQSTVAYNLNTKSWNLAPVKDLVEFSYDETMNENLDGLMQQIPEELLSVSLPVCMQHGDLSKDNLIFGVAQGETAFWWIDWEHAGQRVFFYDYFFYIINSAFYEDRGAFDCYINGQNDETLKAYFAHFDLNFDPGKKWEYFIIFTIIFLKERVCSLGHIGAAVKYCELVKQLKPVG